MGKLLPRSQFVTPRNQRVVAGSLDAATGRVTYVEATTKASDPS